MLIDDLDTIGQAIVLLVLVIACGALAVLGCLFEYLWRWRQEWKRITPESWRPAAKRRSL